ncbi:hypothetical protein EXU57_04190 [Segetibacter sp. 3557_3]|uniref:hypothetical protein n=1 Tax=Segetibacter sp. 3557_3 TaxID=2547429 RepID=UPI001058E306|nr:hypothetical protein [Segetibacter sp. 3557_3]TDH29271.1 hypothetical protein EXU57_04190 [Segetibacter sp. 3557_3]
MPYFPKGPSPLPLIPVMMYSTSSHPEDVERARELGAAGSFPKPDNFNTLKALLSLVMQSWKDGHFSNKNDRSSFVILPQAGGGRDVSGDQAATLVSRDQ